MSEVENIPVVVIGAGVVGCAVAARLAEMGLKPWVLESGPRMAEGVTSRNSGVIHSGIYYPRGSLKAELCIRGQTLLYEWCGEKSVPHRQTGKWIVATSAAEVELLEELLKSAKDCGARDLEIVGPDRLKIDCPDITAEAAIWAPWSGIVDPYEFTRSLSVSAMEEGAEILFGTEVKRVEAVRSGGYRLETARGPILADHVINSAGLRADEVARLAGIDHYRIYPWVGHYFTLRSSRKLASLIYPIKSKNTPGLGVHLTVDLCGGLRLGPDVEIGTSIDDFSEPKDLSIRRTRFFESASRFLPGIREEDLSYHSCGIRPKLRSPEENSEHDFVVSKDRPGWINLVGIESPGLTAAMAIAERVSDLIEI